MWLYVVLKQKEYLPPKHPILIAGGIFLFLYTVSGIFGVSPEVSFWSSISRMSGLVLLYHVGAFVLILVSTVRDRRTWNKIFTAFVGSGFIVALMSYLPYFGLDLPVDSRGGPGIGNSSFAGAYLLFTFFLHVISNF